MFGVLKFGGVNEEDKAKVDEHANKVNPAQKKNIF